ncbi:TRAP-type C4-dicarboxylate transport system, substrate-binding protein [Monaibacterium marinum]|uniref:TRAP-type C4-dicarboxylate transport system, substrate-binding protein n=1 Tax=Pontivivens marinum TaxID=1690039 RepID=A0A2C9CRS3_9RHOB|nr:TRAP transporter substrate-binding protein [Monaibacterium marinum]SOH93932.1 TRAP-type C4-dicarboxylate transport system, substrate-binding protein [Monaibacterium marinum]
MSLIARLTGATFLVAAAFPAHADTWRLSSMMTPDSFEGMAYQKFADLVEEYTEGEIDVRIYPNEQIGSMDSVVEQLSQGVIQLAPSAVSFMSRWEPSITYAGAPFLFDGYDHWSSFINGPLFSSWMETVTAESNISILGEIPDMPRGSFRTLLTDTPIESAADIEGLKIRQFQNDLVIDAWTHLGAEVRVLPWGEVYDGINRGIVDAVTAPAESIESMRFYEVAPYIVRTDEYPQAVAWMMNDAAWNALTPELQDAMTRAHQDAAAYARELLAEASATLQTDLESKDGVTVNFDFDASSLVTKMQTFYMERDAEGELPEGLMSAVDAARAE